MENKFNVKLVYPSEDPDILISLHYTDDIIRAGSISNFHEYENLDLIIPVKNCISRYLYFALPFNWKVWIMVCVGIIYNSLMLNFSLKFIVDDYDFPKHMLECLQLTLWQSMNIRKKHWALSSIYIILMMEGFVLVNLYSMYLGSFLVVDVKEQNFEIAIVANAEVVNREFTNIDMITFKHMSSFEYVVNMVEMNMDYGYAVNKMLWATNSVLRENFKIIRKEVRKPLPLMAVLKKDFRFKEAVNHFLLMEYSHGIYKKWISEFIKLYPPASKDLTSSNYLVLNDFKIVRNMFYFGMGLAFIIFIGELFYVHVIRRLILL